jgi:nicotinamidase-related amidase
MSIASHSTASIEMTTASKTLRDIVGLGQEPGQLRESALIMIDLQNTYRRGVMKLSGVEQAIAEAAKLLEMARDLKVPVIHIQHDGGPGTPYDVRAEIGAISDEVAPIAGESVITKNYPNSFVQTDLDEQLKALGVHKIMLAGFMTHMCINSTAHGGFNLGYAPTVVASATATRALEGANGQVLTAQQVHDAAIASTRDLYAAVVDRVSDLRSW